MHHHTPLITTIVVALVLAFVLGALANRVRISPLVGYLLAGVLIGPFTPGYVADQGMANDLAEIGVILLMFGVGLHFTLEDLLSVRAIAIPGAIAQIASATVMGMGLAYLLGWSIGAGLVFGLALSVASTVVLLRALQERRLVETERGRIAVGWLVVEDFVMILTLVLLPALAGILKGNPGAGASALIMPVLLTLAKVAAFVAVMLVIGKRVIPWLLHAVAHSGSRELFRLSVLAIALGVAFGASMLFDVSFALGAFFAGMILSESELSQRAAQEFAAAARRVRRAVLRIGRHAGRPDDRSARAAAAAGDAADHHSRQVGGGVPDRAHVRLSDLARADRVGEPRPDRRVLLHPGRPGREPRAAARARTRPGPGRGHHLDPAQSHAVCLRRPVSGAARREPAPADEPGAPEAPEMASREPVRATMLTDHVVLVGYGRVGRIVADGLKEQRLPVLLIEEIRPVVLQAREAGVEAIHGNATDPEVIEAANIAAARCLLVAIPDAFEGGQVVAQARAINPALPIVARSHSEEETEHLKKHGATRRDHGRARDRLGDACRCSGQAR